ncbi:MAG: hypothetical protein EOP45_01905 [Sphingobacteriaceae bacterium]|nr:MAG: hypothetical protein EOP45_01905 [Sphingobacteriaceae bacterium]
MVKLFTTLWNSLTPEFSSKLDDCTETLEKLKSEILLAYPSETATLNNIINSTTHEYKKLIPKSYINTSTFERMTGICRLIKSNASIHTNITIAGFNNPQLIPALKSRMTNNKRKIMKLRNEILTSYPNERDLLNTFMDLTWTDFLENEEARIEKSYRPNNVYIDKSAVVNLTHIEPPEDILFILSAGPRFCFPPENTLKNTVAFLADACTHLELHLPPENHFEIYKQLSIEMTIDKKTETAYRIIWLDFLRYRMKNFTEKHPDILFTRSDKGKHAVIIHKDEYFEKMNKLVNTTEDYIQIPNIDLDMAENKINNFVKQLIDSGSINSGDKHKYEDNCTIPSQIYGLIKVHKKDYPVRPIVSSCGSSGFKLANFFTEILTETFDEIGHHVKNTPHVIEKIKGTTLDQDDIMISFDVVSMFTNIPIDHMITLIQKKQYLIESTYNIRFSLFTEILLYLLRDSAIFNWNEKTYRQKDSLAMGSPLSPILAKILMNDILDNILPTLPSQPKALALYVDDSFWVVNKNHVTIISEALNSYHPRIKFTNEIESDQKIAFLNLMIHRTDNELITNWYMKPYASMRLLNYESHHEKPCIIETAKAYLHNVLTISHGNFFHSNKELLIEILRKNSFPENEIITMMHKFYTIMRPIPKSDGFKGAYIPIKYRGNLINRFRYKIRPFLGDNFRVVGVPDRCSSRVFTPLKTKTKINMKTNIIVELRCQCEQKSIFRKTRHGIRAKEIFDELNQYIREGDCSNNQHTFTNVSHSQYVNFKTMEKAFNLLVYANRNRIYRTKNTIPPYFLGKHVDFSLFNK